MLLDVVAPRAFYASIFCVTSPIQLRDETTQLIAIMIRNKPVGDNRVCAFVLAARTLFEREHCVEDLIDIFRVACLQLFSHVFLSLNVYQYRCQIYLYTLCYTV